MSELKQAMAKQVASSVTHSVIDNLSFRLRVEVFNRATEGQAKVKVLAVLPSMKSPTMTNIWLEPIASRAIHGELAQRCPRHLAMRGWPEGGVATRPTLHPRRVADRGHPAGAPRRVGQAAEWLAC